MAFVLKNQLGPATRNNDGNAPVLSQWVKVSKAAFTLPATTTTTIFNVLGGRVLVRALIGEVTTAVQAQACNLSVNIDSDAGAADVLASTLDINADAVGTYYSVEGDGTALLVAEGNAIGCNGNGLILAPGIVTLTTSATNTGATKWDLYYLPLDPAAYVTSA